MFSLRYTHKPLYFCHCKYVVIYVLMSFCWCKYAELYEGQGRRSRVEEAG
jgi:hypothetical protein